MLGALGLLGLSCGLAAQIGGAFVESRDHAAIQYSKKPTTDRIARLNERLRSGAARLTFNSENGYLPSVLDALGVPVDSQVVVFSETSAEAELITPRNPRALYFDDSVAVGWVRGSPLIELAAQDREQGVIFYTLQQQATQKPNFVRTDSCLQCHQTPYTQGVPGTLVFSTFSVPQDKYSYATGAMTDHRSPIGERWGGWYVTGRTAARHLGNIINPTGIEAARKKPVRQLDSLQTEFDTRGFLAPLSDMVALMVLEHQSQMTNYLTRAGWEARLAVHEQREPARPGPGAGRGGAGGRLQEAIEELVDYLLFIDEAPLPASVAGSSGFAARFAGMGPKDSKGRSLRQLDLQRRLLKYPCSYMIYSEAFDALPSMAKDALYRRMWQILSGVERGAAYQRLSLSDRQAIVEILKETKTGLPSYFQRPTT
jgi:hypothetical protein